MLLPRGCLRRIGGEVGYLHRQRLGLRRFSDLGGVSVEAPIFACFQLRSGSATVPPLAHRRAVVPQTGFLLQKGTLGAFCVVQPDGPGRGIDSPARASRGQF